MFMYLDRSMGMPSSSIYWDSSSFSIWGHIYVRSPYFGPHCYYYILIRAWECPPRPYDQMIPHPLLRLCTFSSCSWFGIVVPGFSLFLLFSTPQENHIWLMISIGHTMSSCPRTSGGNLLTPKKCSLPYLPHYMAHLSIFLPYFPWKPWKSH